MRDRDLRRADHYEAAQWIAYAVNAPDKLPDFKTTAELAAPAPVSDAADQARVRGFFIAAALASQTPKES